jgi:uncharacterized membrane protein
VESGFVETLRMRKLAVMLVAMVATALATALAMVVAMAPMAMAQERKVEPSCCIAM